MTEAPSLAMQVNVIAALQARGWDAAHEYPGIVSITCGPFVVNTGMHAWDYGTPAVILPPSPQLACMSVEPFEDAPWMGAGCSPAETNVDVVAEAWDFALRGWLEEQHVRPDLIPERKETLAC